MKGKWAQLEENINGKYEPSWEMRGKLMNHRVLIILDVEQFPFMVLVFRPKDFVFL